MRERDEAASLPQACARKARECLLAELKREGCFTGELSSSALSTALAAFSLHLSAPGVAETHVRQAAAWLLRSRNADGGWGDSPDSPSNRTTTLVTWAVLDCIGGFPAAADAPTRQWLAESLGETTPARIREKILEDYGADRTFSVPILTLLALTGKLPWTRVPQLPFELSVFPTRLFRWLQLPVVSYALPALIAIGLVRHRCRPSGWFPVRWLRTACAARSLRRLAQIQPENGGFLEAAPLTAFVLMSLAGAGEKNHPVAGRCAVFLRQSQRGDGSWPIDTNLSVWLTSLSIDALADTADGLPDDTTAAVRHYLLAAQAKQPHPYTGAAPGGWPWTHLPGGVPDADDTAGALTALHKLSRRAPSPGNELSAAVEAGVVWLLDLQNRDGGMPTFCRGWGRFPFDRSCPDITAHALKAVTVWSQDLPALRRRIRRFASRAVMYLRRSQRGNGSWLPLWFGNQQAPGFDNPVYGTAQVVTALAECPLATRREIRELIDDGRLFLRTSQNADGGWGGIKGARSSIEETALALRALAVPGPDEIRIRAEKWLLQATEGGTRFPAAPIGLYFSRLWYSERLYPLIHLAALERSNLHSNDAKSY